MLGWGGVAVPDQNPASREEAEHGPERGTALGGYSQSRRPLTEDSLLARQEVRKLGGVK